VKADSRTPQQALRELESLRLSFGAAAALRKLLLLRSLARARFATAPGLVRLHEHLCFMAAFPDDARVLKLVRALLDGFSRRPDLRRHANALADSGIAGTRIHYAFFWPTARRLACWYPAKLHIDWDAIDDAAPLAAALPQLVPPVVAAWLRARDPDVRDTIGRLSRGSTSGSWLVDRVNDMPGNDMTREAFFDALDTPFVLHPGRDTPSRTTARHAGSPVFHVRKPARRDRPDLRQELLRPPRGIRRLSPREGERLIRLACGALVTRSRDIDGIAYGDPADVWLVSDDEGLQWAFFGLVPERRQVLRASHGFLTLRSGVPIGYGQFDTLFRTSDVSFNSFGTFRGSSTSWLFARLLAAARALLGAEAFTLDGYQVGHRNEEAIAAGAWWFYYRLGFRSRDPDIRKIAAREVARMRIHPEHRSTPATLRRLAAGTLYFETAGVRAPEWERLLDLGARVAAPGTRSAQSDRRGPGSHVGVERWAPLVALLPIERWSVEERRSLARVIDAKGRRSERDYLRAFDAHPRLAPALRRLMGGMPRTR